MERIVLIGGPCSGQIHDVEDGTRSVKSADDDDGRHVYVRTEAVDVEDDLRVVIFRLAGPLGADKRSSTSGRHDEQSVGASRR